MAAGVVAVADETVVADDLSLLPMKLLLLLLLQLLLLLSLLVAAVVAAGSGSHQHLQR